jgi:hypothetical protein
MLRPSARSRLRGTGNEETTAAAQAEDGPAGHVITEIAT